MISRLLVLETLLWLAITGIDVSLSTSLSPKVGEREAVSLCGK